MLRSLHMKDTGPASRFDLDLGERLNVLTGDNGLGKSFVLDVAWWALTGTWTGRPARPRQEDTAEPSIEWTIQSRDGGSVRKKSDFSFSAQRWSRPKGKTVLPGLVVYAQVDGSFSVWDPARNNWRQLKAGGLTDPNKPDAYQFSKHELWNGLEFNRSKICNGLLQDWVTWQRDPDQNDQSPFRILTRVLEELSPPGERIHAGLKTVRLAINDPIEYPTLVLHGDTIPIVHASAAVQRILGLAYLMVWTWSEHFKASQLLKQPPSEGLVFLMDEVETHLHPKWQRRLLPSLLQTLRGLGSDMFKVQAMVTTHSPLILASLEPFFKLVIDKFFNFELSGQGNEVSLEELPWVKYGDAISWLTSPIFRLRQGRSIEAERAIEAAEALMREELTALPEGLQTEDQIHRELLRVLPDQDRFWPRWIVRRERRTA